METAHTPAAMARIDALASRLDRPIALVGLMGAGKSTVGRKLATLLQRSFIDADDAIVYARVNVMSPSVLVTVMVPTPPDRADVSSVKVVNAEPESELPTTVEPSTVATRCTHSPRGIVASGVVTSLASLPTWMRKYG